GLLVLEFEIKLQVVSQRLQEMQKQELLSSKSRRSSWVSKLKHLLKPCLLLSWIEQSKGERAPDLFLELPHAIVAQSFLIPLWGINLDTYKNKCAIYENSLGQTCNRTVFAFFQYIKARGIRVRIRDESYKFPAIFAFQTKGPLQNKHVSTGGYG
ncbi:MAG: hypothetical protein RL553_2093, partial [Planctomycetota bacterium]